MTTTKKNADEKLRLRASCILQLLSLKNKLKKLQIIFLTEETVTQRHESSTCQLVKTRGCTCSAQVGNFNSLSKVGHMHTCTSVERGNLTWSDTCSITCVLTAIISAVFECQFSLGLITTKYMYTTLCRLDTFFSQSLQFLWYR